MTTNTDSIVIRVHPETPSAAFRFLSRQTSCTSESQVAESALLRSIRSALRGSTSDSINAVYAPLYDDGCDSWAEQELAWNDRCVVLSHGGVIQRKWDFSDEDQTIQCACIGRFAYGTNTTGPVHGSAHYTSKAGERDADPSTESVFGPFKTVQEERQKSKHVQEDVSAVFVFLRSIGKVYLINGTDYTFSLPFLVRKAWPLHPHGVMIQRLLDPLEIDDSRATGDAPLPTTFTITNPFSEPAAVGITAGIVGGFPGRPACLSDEEENHSRPLAVIPAFEEVVWVSRKPFAIDDILITFDSERQELSIWRYVYQPGHRSSPSRFDLSSNLDRMALGSDGEVEGLTAATEHGRMKASFWAQRMIAHPYAGLPQGSLPRISAALFDQRFDGVRDHTLLAICMPGVPTAVFLLTVQETNNTVACSYLTTIDAVSVVPVGATRKEIWDLLAIKSDGSLTIFTHGLQELPIVLGIAQAGNAGGEGKNALVPVTGITSIKSACVSSVALLCADGQAYRGKFDMLPRDRFVNQALQVLSLIIPTKDAFAMHVEFLRTWSRRNFGTSSNMEAHALTFGLVNVLDLAPSYPDDHHPSLSTDWEEFFVLSTNVRNFQNDPALHRLSLPAYLRNEPSTLVARKPNPLLAPVLYALHMLAEDLRLVVYRHDSLMLLVPLVCQIAHIIRPEWADYWKRLCPNITSAWPSPSTMQAEMHDDRIPVWPPDMTAILYSRIGNPDWRFPVYETPRLAAMFDIQPSYAFGKVEPLSSLQCLTTVYLCLSDSSISSAQRRAEITVETLVRMWGTARKGHLFLDSLPLGVAAPLREAIRTCQLSPPPHWQPEQYELVGRRDLAFSVAMVQPVISQQGVYQSAETYMTSHHRTTISALVEQARVASAGEVDALSGVELGLNASIRFGQDRRLEEVARMLCSSAIPSVRLVERPDLNEHDQAKEQQHQVVRITERTLALPYGRAMFTFGSVLTVTREAYVIPKLEYQIKVQPSNVITGPEAGKIPLECTNWGEFHNGVAAGLRIAPWARGVESSWIAFNKPSELTPEHAGFLYGLGLTGHLKEMLTWHTFGYLTPKHDLTSIGVLLGLSAANIGSGNMHVTKLLAVHTPALLPTPTVDLNVSLMTQAAGLAGVGLLYLGTKDRRMAEVCLNQISRKDLVQPDLSNEHREAYTYSAALAFGMIMLGKGSPIPADIACLHRLRVLIHGETKTIITGRGRPTFDVNITSPAASIALGLMYLKTEQKDVADILELPSTVVELNHIQPSFLVMRTIARSLIMWSSVGPTADWLVAQIPEPIITAMQDHATSNQRADDAIELAYYNIIAGYCFAIGLKYAGTARHEAYITLSSYFDTFSRFVATTGPGFGFDQKIKRSAVREGLNLISIALCMVMAGTGEISCLRRLRYAFGMYHQAFRYGVHVATHLSLGVLFLGAGRFTLGTSNAAIACMVAAFFPRFHHVSSDNKSYLQALRHLWVLAVEPRCLIARDVTTREAVYLPVKITTKEGNEKGVTQLISPTLIPDFGKLASIRIDTPRYWPFFVDFENVPEHKTSFLRNQTLYVKRRTAFLSYTEDPRGSRSLFVRSGSSAGDAATLDFPQLTDAKAHPASDLTHFISSFSNDTLFLAFADYFSRDDGETAEERTFHAYCHAALLDSILQDKMETLQSHLTLYQYRTQPQSTSHFHLRLQDLRFAVDFYSKVYDRRFSGRAENNPRPPLIRENTVSGALQALDERLERVQDHPAFTYALGCYARGELFEDMSESGSESDDTPSSSPPSPSPLSPSSSPSSPSSSASASSPGRVSRWLAWYLTRNGVPSASLLVILRQLAREAHAHSTSCTPPEGTTDLRLLDVGIKEVLRGTGTKMINAFGSGWSGASLDRIVEAWQAGVQSA